MLKLLALSFLLLFLSPLNETKEVLKFRITDLGSCEQVPECIPELYHSVNLVLVIDEENKVIKLHEETKIFVYNIVYKYPPNMEDTKGQEYRTLDFAGNVTLFKYSKTPKGKFMFGMVNDELRHLGFMEKL